jgi:thymidylate synthase (FAD)
MSINLRNDFVVEHLIAAGSDEFICRAARVSTQGSASIDSEESAGLINFLMKNRHGSPFEHGFMTFRIEAPIFIWREFMRHRIGFSYNEQSGRYMELSPEFYVPPADRNLIQVGKTGAYDFVPGTEEQYRDLIRGHMLSYQLAWDMYQEHLDAGVAKEVARMCLPVSIYSHAYVSCNPRSIMSFLSLRTKVEGSMFPSFPMWEINQVANEIEAYFAHHFPLTHKAFCDNGRVSP